MTVAEPGQFMIKFSDQNESNPINVFSSHTNIIGGAAKTAPTGETYKAIPFTATGMLGAFKVDGRILVYFSSDANDTIESEDSGWEIPMLIYNKAGQVVNSIVLTQENMTGFTQAGTVDVVVVAGVPSRIAYYDVPRGLIYGLDPNGKVRAYMSDDT